MHVWESVHHAYPPKGPHAAYAPMQHTRGPGSVGSHGGHLPKPMYPRTYNADGAAMREITWRTHACNCSDAPNGCGRWRARARLLHTPAGIAAAAVTRLRACCTPRSQLAAASAQPAAATTRRLRVTRFSIVHAFPKSGYRTCNRRTPVPRKKYSNPGSDLPNTPSGGGPWRAGESRPTGYCAI